MYKYFIKTPLLVKRLFSSYIWSIPVQEKIVYLTFDDGPHPEITPWVLEQLKQYDAKATFFCIGNNVQQFPGVYKSIIDAGHATGNHTYHHLNGWVTTTNKYVNDVKAAASLISSDLFRPPYGHIRKGQARRLLGEDRPYRIIMWDVLSADWHQEIPLQQCVDNVLKNVQPGSIIVFHDSKKAEKNLRHTLPVVLEKLKSEGYAFEKIV